METRCTVHHPALIRQRASSPVRIRACLLAIALSIAGIAGGCATAGSGTTPDDATAPEAGPPSGAVPNGTLTLGAVVRVLTRQEIMHGEDGKGARRGIPATRKQLLDRGYSDGDIVNGSVVVVAYQVYRHSARGATRTVWGTALVPKGMSVSENYYVEVETIAGVRQKERREGGCGFKLGERGAMSILDTINPIGGPRTGNFDCPGLEEEGWVKTPAGYVGGYMWRKFPKPPLPGQ
jgi:hypothetical protein